MKPAALSGSYLWHLRSGKGCRQAPAQLDLLRSCHHSALSLERQSGGGTGKGELCRDRLAKPVLDRQDIHEVRPI